MSHPVNYLRYTRKMNLDKAIHTLEGILKGIAVDSVITVPEVRELSRWRTENIEYSKQHPFNEVMPKVDAALNHGLITIQE